MNKLIFLTANYEESEHCWIQGKENSDRIQQFKKYGFQIDKNRSGNGNYLLIRPAQVNACFKDITDTQYSFEVKSEILEHYSRQKMSYNLFERFCKEAKRGMIEFYINEAGNCIFN